MNRRTRNGERTQMNFKFVGFEEQGRTVMINLAQIIALENTSQGKKPRLEVFMMGDGREPRYTLNLTIKEFFENCKLL